VNSMTDSMIISLGLWLEWWKLIRAITARLDQQTLSNHRHGTATMIEVGILEFTRKPAW
jgi:hypothetical protein